LICAALVDVGGTLWPECSLALEADEELRAGRLQRALPVLTHGLAGELVRRFRLKSADLDGQLVQDTWEFIRGTTGELRLSLADQDMDAVRSAMCLPALGRYDLLPGARELLTTIKALGLPCVLVSNGIWRTGADYRKDFEDLGAADYIDAIISSVDLGFRKPHRVIFEAALAACGCQAPRCVMIGNSEEKDVEPALAMGMRTIRVAIEEPKPAASAAHAVVGSLYEVPDVLRVWMVTNRISV